MGTLSVSGSPKSQAIEPYPAVRSGSYCVGEGSKGGRRLIMRLHGATCACADTQ